MAKPVSCAVILAAGMGLRLRDTHSLKPKGFIEIGGRTLIERSLNILKKHNISDVVIVTGHLGRFYDEMAATQDGVRIIHNEKFADSGSMYSLFCARDAVDRDFLLLESDLLFERRAVRALIESPHPNAILMSGFTQSGDEVFIEAEGERFVRMSKDRAELSLVAGELVGLSRISASLFDTMKAFAACSFRSDLHLEYEACLNGVAGTVPVHVCKVSDLIWGEIDDASHLARVREETYPAIEQKERRKP